MARNVQVVLTEDLPNVGNSGELVRVKAGFARNFLIPRGLAAMATKTSVARVEHERRVAQVRAVKHRAAADELSNKLKGVKLTLHAQVGEEQKLYGSITTRDIETALAEKGFEIDRRKIIAEPIKELGTHKVTIKIASGVDAEIEVEVAPRS
jgi:large subunit ribosomal protein L9